MTQTVLTHAAIAAMTPGGAAYGWMPKGAIAIDGARIAWCGDASDLPDRFKNWQTTDMDGRVITPALIDCHTHIIHGGNRAREFEMRLGGASYADIAVAGGGIVSTMKATRAASQDELIAQSLPRIDSLIAEGVSVIEIKSGYGLCLESELKMLRAARQIETMRDVRVMTTFLGAHALPPEYKDNPDGYIDAVCIPALKAAHAEGLVDAVDGFCENIGFNAAQITRVFEAAKALDLPVKLHAEQLSNMSGAALAASFDGLSADHLEYIDAAGIDAMAKSGTVAVMLPGAFYTLSETRKPPIEGFRAAGVPMAVATDCNPGTSPIASILTVMNMACVQFGMTPEEALAGATRNAARALGLSGCGMIAPGLRADLAVWDIEHPNELSYRIGPNPLHQRIIGGRI